MSERCAWCDDSGFVYLRRYVARKRKRVAHTFNSKVKRWAKTKNVTYPMNDAHKAELRQMQREATIEDRYVEQVLAACRRCPLGESKHKKAPWLAYDYTLEEVDVALENAQLAQLDGNQRQRYYEVRKAEAAMAERTKELAAPMAEDEAQYTWSNPGTMQPAPSGSDLHPDTRNED